MPSVITNRDRDCFGCRMVSGLGLVGAGAYLTNIASKNPAKLGKITIYTLAVAFTGMGVARLFDLPPFRHKIQDQ